MSQNIIGLDKKTNLLDGSKVELTLHVLNDEGGFQKPAPEEDRGKTQQLFVSLQKAARPLLYRK